MKRIKMNGLKSSWWKGPLFISSLFGSFVATLYVFSLYSFLGKFEYSGYEDFLSQLLSSILPMWTMLFIFVMLLYKLTKDTIDKWLLYMGFTEKAYVGFGTLIYVFFASLLLGITYLMSLSFFNSFSIISTLSVGVIFANSMGFALKKIEKMESNI